MVPTTENDPFMPNRSTHDFDPRYVPFYTATDIARLVRVNPVTLAYWSKPISRLNQALVNRVDPSGSRSPFSFMNMIEAYVMASLRSIHGMKMSNIRRGVKWLKDHYPEQPYPLATLKVITDGLELFVEDTGLIISATRKGQIAIRPVISPYLQRIEWAKDGLPKAFYPFTSDVKGPSLVTIDPSIQFGQPIIRHTRVKTEIIASRFEAGESIADLSRDYDIDSSAIEEALRCERLRKSA